MARLVTRPHPLSTPPLGIGLRCMQTLQALIVYHPLSTPPHPLGIGLVFVTLAYQIYAKYKASKQAALDPVRVRVRVSCP